MYIVIYNAYYITCTLLYEIHVYYITCTLIYIIHVYYITCALLYIIHVYYIIAMIAHCECPEKEIEELISIYTGFSKSF